MAAVAAGSGAVVDPGEAAAASATEAAMGLGEATRDEARAPDLWGGAMVKRAATAGKAAGSASCM